MEKSLQLTNREISVFCMQISYILKAGIPLCDGIDSLLKEAKKGRVRDVLEIINGQLRLQSPMHSALEYTKAFPSYVCGMVKIGDSSGKLEDVMQSLSLYYEKEALISMRLKSAVLYPALLFVLMSFVVAVLVLKVLPMFQKIFAQLGGDISHSAGYAMYFGMVTGYAALIIIFIIIVVYLILALISRSKKGRELIYGFFSAFPLTRSFMSRIIARRFACAMALMLSSGANVGRAMEMTSSVMDNKAICEKISNALELIERGDDMAISIASMGIFPHMFCQTMAIGFKTGSSDGVMSRLAKIYEDDIDEIIDKLLSFIEPTLIGVISVIIGMILISVLLPLTGMMAAIG